MSGPETNFTNRIRAALKGTNVYSMKLQAGYIAGVPDMWFSGSKSDLWVEMKWDARSAASKKPFEPGLSVLQKQWLNDRLAQGRNVAVITGTPHGALIQVHGTWNSPVATTAFTAALLPVKQVAEWIIKQVSR